MNANIVTITSQAHPAPRQKHRSSENFYPQSLGNGIIAIKAYYQYGTQKQQEANDIIFDVNIDKTGKDGVFASNIKSGHVCQNTNDRNLYIANPRNAITDFTVEVSLI